MKKLLIVIAVLVLAEFIVLPLYCSRVIAAAESESAEVQLRHKIVELTKAQEENRLLTEELTGLKKELAVLKLKTVKEEIIKKKTKDKSSPVYFDVNIMSPKEQVQKLDRYIEEVLKKS
jgi:hypothetical protein